MKNVAKLVGAHRRVLLVFDQADDVERLLGEFVTRAAGATLDVVAMIVLPEWSADRLEVRTRTHLRHLAEKFTSPDIRLSADLALGEPVSAILDAVAKHDSDLIAMTVHGVGVIDRLLDHSILEVVLRQAPVPVVAISASPDAN